MKPKLNTILVVIAVLALGLGYLLYLFIGVQKENKVLAAKLARVNAKGRTEPSPKLPLPSEPAIKVPLANPGDSSQQAMSEREQAELKVRTMIRQDILFRLYGYLFDALGNLDPAKRHRLKEFLYERELAKSGAGRAFEKSGGFHDAQTFMEAMQAAASKIDQGIVARFGPDGPKIAELLGLFGAMEIINTAIADDMAFAEVPLSSEQKVQLAAIMKDLHYAGDDPLYAGLVSEPVEPRTGLQPIYRDLLNRAKPLLSSAQLAVLRARQDEQLAGQNYSRAAFGP